MLLHATVLPPWSAGQGGLWALVTLSAQLDSFIPGPSEVTGKADAPAYLIQMFRGTP